MRTPCWPRLHMQNASFTGRARAPRLEKGRRPSCPPQQPSSQGVPHVPAQRPARHLLALQGRALHPEHRRRDPRPGPAPAAGRSHPGRTARRTRAPRSHLLPRPGPHARTARGLHAQLRRRGRGQGLLPEARSAPRDRDRREHVREAEGRQQLARRHHLARTAAPGHQPVRAGDSRHRRRHAVGQPDRGLRQPAAGLPGLPGNTHRGAHLGNQRLDRVPAAQGRQRRRAEGRARQVPAGGAPGGARAPGHRQEDPVRQQHLHQPHQGPVALGQRRPADAAVRTRPRARIPGPAALGARHPGGVGQPINPALRGGRFLPAAPQAAPHHDHGPTRPSDRTPRRTPT